MSPEDEVRKLCLFMSKAEGDELDAAIAELQSLLRTILVDLDNLSVYNVTTFPAAMERRKKA
jgi:hypothetical protein